MGAGVVEKGDGNVRGVSDSSGGQSGVGCTKEMGRFLGWRARGLAGAAQTGEEYSWTPGSLKEQGLD